MEQRKGQKPPNLRGHQLFVFLSGPVLCISSILLCSLSLSLSIPLFPLHRIPHRGALEGALAAITKSPELLAGLHYGVAPFRACSGQSASRHGMHPRFGKAFTSQKNKEQKDRLFDAVWRDGGDDLPHKGPGSTICSLT